MTNATAEAPVRATKATARQKAAASPPSVAEEQASPASPATDDEKTVAATAVEQLQDIYETHWKDLGMYASGLLHTAISRLSTIHDKQDEVDRGDVFHSAAAAISGALAITRAAQSEGIVIGPLQGVFQILESAAISYGFVQEPCEALAVGIQAGYYPHRDQPRSPLRRVEEDTEHQRPSALTRTQLITVLEVAASDLATINNVLMQAQAENEPWALSGLVNAAQCLVRHCGGMVDQAAGEAIFGGQDDWNFGLNFANAGKAGAA